MPSSRCLSFMLDADGTEACGRESYITLHYKAVSPNVERSAATAAATTSIVHYWTDLEHDPLMPFTTLIAMREGADRLSVCTLLYAPSVCSPAHSAGYEPSHTAACTESLMI